MTAPPAYPIVESLVKEEIRVVYDVIWSIVVFVILIGAIAYYGYNETSSNDENKEKDPGEGPDRK
jgi:nitric oxide reductase large subunit